MNISSKFLIIFISFGFCLLPAEQPEPFVFITHYNLLTIETWTPECGEFGSNYERLTIHRHKEERILVANYYKSDINCKSHEAKVYERNNIVLHKPDIELLEVCVSELVEMTINNQILISHVGITNSLYTTDSSIVMSDWPSAEWESLVKLKATLETRRTIANKK